MEYQNKPPRRPGRGYLAVRTLMLVILAAPALAQAQTSRQETPNAARGLVTLHRALTDRDGDGVAEFLDRYEESTYDDRGNRVLLVEHGNRNDRWFVKTTTNTYDGASNLIHELEESGSQRSERWLEYDRAGNLIEEVIEKHNRSGLHLVKRRTYRYDERGELVEEIHDEDYVTLNDRRIRWTFAHDERGALVEKVEEHDSGNDGVLDRVQRWTFAYNERGDLLQETWESGYGGFDLTRQTYDSAGRLQERILESFDADFRLLADHWTEFSQDPTGAEVQQHHIIRSFSDSEPRTVVEVWWTDRYDARGNLVERHIEEEYRGSRNDVTWTVSFDPRGRPVESTSFWRLRYPDGELRTTFGDVTTYEYDQWGNLVEETLRGERDGSRTRTTTSLYEY